MKIQINTAAAARRIAEYRRNPVEMVKSECRTTPDDWQGDALMAYPNNPRLALQACVGPGKTAVLAWIGLNFGSTRPLPKIACTSITWDNLRDNLWAEYAKWIARSELFRGIFQWTATRVFLKENPEQSWIAARTWDRSAEAEQQAKTLSGLHADYILAIADETGGMPVPVLQAAEGVLSSAVEGHVVQAGNPTHLSGALYYATERSNGAWRTIRITGDPDDPNRAPRVAKEWAEEQIKIWGRDSSFVRSKILGKYPRQATDALVGVHHFEDAYGRYGQDRPVSYDGDRLECGIRSLGVDVARFGTDKTVVTLRDGDFIRAVWAWRNKDTDETCSRVARIAVDECVETVCVDDIGVGGGVTDGLKQRARDGVLSWQPQDKNEPPVTVHVVGVNVARASTKRDLHGKPRFANLKAEYNFNVGKRFAKGEIALCPKLRDTTTLLQEGTDIRYSFARGGGCYKIEDKADYKNRHNGESPDYWDSLVLALSARRTLSAGAFGF